MATTLKKFIRGNGTQSYTFTNPGLINNIVISNTSGSQQTYSITLATFSIVTSGIIPANDTVILDLKQYAEINDVLATSGTSCAFHISGVEISA
jgi:hypothetical protein